LIERFSTCSDAQNDQSSGRETLVTGTIKGPAILIAQFAGDESAVGLADVVQERQRGEPGASQRTEITQFRRAGQPSPDGWLLEQSFYDGRHVRRVIDQRVPGDDRKRSAEPTLRL